MFVETSTDQNNYTEFKYTGTGICLEGLVNPHPAYSPALANIPGVNMPWEAMFSDFFTGAYQVKEFATELEAQTWVLRRFKFALFSKLN